MVLTTSTKLSELKQPSQSLWLDDADALRQVGERTSDLWLKVHAQNMIQNGYTVLRGMNTAAYCDRVMEDYYQFCEEVGMTGEKRSPKARVNNFHMYSENALKVCLDQDLMRLLSFLFGYPAALYTTLTFEYGTEQAIHRDSPYFDTQPFGYYFGVWTALEDISPDSGPLELLAGGHRVAGLDYKALARALMEQKGGYENSDYDGLLRQFFLHTSESCAGCDRKIEHLSKGDKLIWHHWLPHGGSTVKDASLTRQSIVGHYVPIHVPVYNVDVFFGHVNPPEPRTYQYQEREGEFYIQHGAAHFAGSYI
jgi:phytanoyl-CoA hydroxylase